MTLHLREDTPLDPVKIARLVQPKRSLYRLAPDGRLSRRTADGERFASGLEAAEVLLRDIAGCARDEA